MTLTKISASSNREDLYQLFVDGKFLCSISGNDLLETKLSKGSKLDSEQINDLLYRSLRGKLTNAALNFLAGRPRSVQEVRNRLKTKLYQNTLEIPEYRTLNTEDISEEIIRKLEAKSLLDDRAFANWLVNARTVIAKTPKSKTAIKTELMKKGISNDLISQVLSQIDIEAEADQAKILAEKKILQLKRRNLDENDLRIKTSRFLISRGYSWETTRTAVDSILKPF